LKELNTAKLLSSKPLISGLEIGIQCLLNSENEQLILESLWRPVLASSAGERPSAIYITFFSDKYPGTENAGAIKHVS
jgi:hypothetical protein